MPSLFFFSRPILPLLLPRPSLPPKRFSFSVFFPAGPTCRRLLPSPSSSSRAPPSRTWREQRREMPRLPLPSCPCCPPLSSLPRPLFPSSRVPSRRHRFSPPPLFFRHGSRGEAPKIRLLRKPIVFPVIAGNLPVDVRVPECQDRGRRAPVLRLRHLLRRSLRLLLPRRHPPSRRVAATVSKPIVDVTQPCSECAPFSLSS